MSNLLTELRRRNVIRVAGAYLVLSWLLLQIGEVTFDFLDVPDWAGKLLIAFLGIGFIPVVIFSWVYELTPEGIKLEKDVDRSESITGHTAKKLDVVTIVMLIAAVGFVMLDRFVFEQAATHSGPVAVETRLPALPPEGSPAPVTTELEAPAPEATIDEQSVAVLPFINMSPDPDNEYFSDGLSETLLHMLAQINGLKVAARTSSFAFKGQNADVNEIARTLKVAHVLEGSVQKAGGKVRVTAQLIDASEGTHLWSDNYDRDLEDIFAIQDEIAQHVVDALKVELLGEDRERIVSDQTDNVAAYEAYLRGIQYLPQRRTEGLQAAIGHLEEAIALDPGFAMAHARLYDATSLLNEYATTTAQQRARADASLDRALQLAPDLGIVQSSLGNRLREKGEYAAAEAAFKRAFELSPSYAAAHHFYAYMLRSYLGRWDEALEHHRIAHELDPLSAVIHANVGWSLAAAGYPDEAKDAFSAVIE
ncbi:MAG: hypothetical protein R3200_17010, partial [Xanthomonadales bacterium]|nr:hypothetical protein [Xanthomonadales bacterium]